MPSEINNVFHSKDEISIRAKRLRQFQECPIQPEEDILNNLGLFINSRNLSRILFFDFLYRKIIETQGIIIEFGTQWGQNLSLFTALRGIYEPYNRQRTIVGFDTFCGLTKFSDKDNKNIPFSEGSISTTENYELYLENLLLNNEQENPLQHIKKFKIVKGDVTKTLDKYLNSHPETIIALAWFDMDIFEPTAYALEKIKPYLVKGSIVGFDELNDVLWPGETVALREVFGLNNIRLQRHKYASRVSWFEFK